MANIQQKMVFSSFLFLFLFLPVVLIINRLLPLRWSNVFLLIVSLLFYFVGEGKLTILLALSILWNYVFGRLLALDESHSKKDKLLLGICITGNLLLLVYYKYFGFIVTSLGLDHIIPESSYSSIVLPIGISFFTFQGISYIIDVYGKTEKAEKDPVKLGLYISLFPQLIAGPIIKYNEIAKDISHRSFNLDDAVNGSFKFIRGLFKKVVLANNFSVIADAVFESDINSLPTSVAWIGLLLYSLQIYFDFSGYSDMAIGLGQIMGFKIPENFNFPYISRSIKEFWRRWHISLSTWFKNYLYIPLGGNRKGAYRTYLNLAIVFFVTGLWHGANYNFIIWGMLHGAFLVAERMKASWLAILPRFLQHVYTLMVVSLAWVFFRTATIDDAFHYFSRLFAFSEVGDYSAFLHLNNYIVFLLALGVLLVTPIRTYLVVHWNKLMQQMPVGAKYTLALGLYQLVFIFALFELSIATHTPFIYFKF